MKRLSVPAALFLAACILMVPSVNPQTSPRQHQPADDSDAEHLPNGKLRQDEILKEEHEKSIKDAAQLVELAESLKEEIEKEDAHVLSIATLKKTEEIEKIARRIRARIKH